MVGLTCWQRRSPWLLLLAGSHGIVLIMDFFWLARNYRVRAPVVFEIRSPFAQLSTWSLGKGSGWMNLANALDYCRRFVKLHCFYLVQLNVRIFSQPLVVGVFIYSTLLAFWWTGGCWAKPVVTYQTRFRNCSLQHSRSGRNEIPSSRASRSLI
jgi:hypothetical protein